jgi:aromatic ring-opening dioxygenase LigB subunit
MIKKIGIFPHPPIVIPEIGKDESNKIAKTYESMERLAKEFIDEGITKILIISPHGPAYSRMLAINVNERLIGDLKNFNYYKKFEFKNISKLSVEFLGKDFYPIKAPLDHGVLVPLYFFEKLGKEIEVISISTGFMEKKELEKMGKIIGCILNGDSVYKKEDFGLIVSADLSHRLKEDSYYGFSEEGSVFDEMVFEAVQNGKVEELINIPAEIVEGAGQCGYIPLLLAAFAVSGLKVSSEVFSYEKPFGVGYLVGKGDIEYE